MIYLMSEAIGKNGFLSELIRPHNSLRKGPRRLLFYLVLFTYIASGIYGAAKFSPESRCQYLVSLFLILNVALFIFLIMVWSFIPALGFALIFGKFIAMSTWGIYLLVTELRTWKNLGLDEAGGYYCDYTSIGLVFLITCLNSGFLLLLTTVALIQFFDPRMLYYPSPVHDELRPPAVSYTHLDAADE